MNQNYIVSKSKTYITLYPPPIYRPLPSEYIEDNHPYRTQYSSIDEYLLWNESIWLFNMNNVICTTNQSDLKSVLDKEIGFYSLLLINPKWDFLRNFDTLL